MRYRATIIIEYNADNARPDIHAQAMAEKAISYFEDGYDAEKWASRDRHGCVRVRSVTGAVVSAAAAAAERVAVNGLRVELEPEP